jgi:hypothetical protein
MKTLVVLAFFAGIYINAAGQKYVPVVKDGTVFNYDAFAKGLGQHIPLVFTIKSLGDPIKIRWDVDGYGTGSFEMPAKSLQSATKVVIKQPEPDAITQIKEDETIIAISKDAFAAMIKDKVFEMNGQKFVVAADTAVCKVNDKQLDVIYATTLNGKSEVWIINNPDFPVVYRAKNVSHGIDFTLTGIKE